MSEYAAIHLMWWPPARWREVWLGGRLNGFFLSFMVWFQDFLYIMWLVEGFWFIGLAWLIGTCVDVNMDGCIDWLTQWLTDYTIDWLIDWSSWSANHSGLECAGQNQHLLFKHYLLTINWGSLLKYDILYWVKRKWCFFLWCLCTVSDIPQP